ncbi:lipoprotein [Marinobacterium nitratireducens]|uniref:Lipoprotein n=1 Tax=Marinobacterium nitratireducens TaxID=518897 RepID=A0A917ZBD5_9GAMM|nr:YSC84-related protein [Marinobacterium nitratireducens]GGO79618.1 lipoprotein [Marinobacterium nitratireducens]
MRLRQFVFAVFALMIAVTVQAASREEIDAKADEALQTLYQESQAARELALQAKGVLVFPEVYKAGVGIGGEYGEGALRIGGQTVDYYSTASASIGLQLGAQIKSQVVLFMTQEALDKFRTSKGWEAGVDGSVAIATLGTGGTIDTHTLQQPIIGFVFSNKGLMANLTLEGSKITRMDK